MRLVIDYPPTEEYRRRVRLALRAMAGEGAEQPQYPALAEALEKAVRQVRRPAATLRRALLAAVNADRSRGMRKPLTGSEEAGLDDAIEAFLAEVAGQKRGRSDFTDPSEPGGLIHRFNDAGWRTGAERAADLLEAEQPVSALTEAIKERLYKEAFALMSDGTRLRLEGDLAAIKEGIIAGFERGDSPMEIARQLAADLGSLERARLELIARNEIARASEAGIRDEFRENGLTRAEVIGDPGTDADCTSRIGNTYDLDDLDNLPPFHVSCLCSLVPIASEG